MASRKIEDLVPELQRRVKFIQEEATFVGLDILIYCTRRNFAEQARLFRHGRSLEEIQEKARILRERHDRHDLADLLLGVGPQRSTYKLTMTGPGESLLHYGLGFECVPMREGRIVWLNDNPEEHRIWGQLASICKRQDLVWCGDYCTFDYPCFQLPGIDKKDLLRRPYE